MHPKNHNLIASTFGMSFFRFLNKSNGEVYLRQQNICRKKNNKNKKMEE